MRRELAALGLVLAGCAGTTPEPPFSEVSPPAPVELVWLSKDQVGPLRPFAIAAREVTWREFLAFTSRKSRRLDGITTPSNILPFFGDVGLPPECLEPDHPVINLRWHSALVYCEWMSKGTGDYYRLPTEREWEVAARAGSRADRPEEPGEHAWYRANSGTHSHAVGSLRPNAWGLYDMLGNAWEYCLEPEVPPRFGPVLRGGAWDSVAEDLAYSRHRTIPQQWVEADPQRPRSLWWLVGEGASAGIRLVRVADRSRQEERARYLPQIEVRILRQEEEVLSQRNSREYFRHVWGELRNRGSRGIDEVELVVFSLTPEGKPHRTDISANPVAGRPTWNKCWPVLVNSAQEGLQGRPLRPGEARSFEVFVPETFDDPADVDETRFGGQATNLSFSPS